MSLSQAAIGKHPTVVYDHRRWIRNAAIVAAAVLMGCAWTIPTAAQDGPPHPMTAFAPTAVADSDGDGLTDEQEIMLGTDPASIDSDCDLKGDFQEAGAVTAPADSDQDGAIDALESEQIDSNQYGDVDEHDPESGPQLSCGRFQPFAVAADGSEESRLEVRVAGTAVSDLVSVFASSKTPPALDGAVLTSDKIEIELYDDGSHGDRTAGDEIWTRGHFTYKHDVAPGAYVTPFTLSYIQVRTGSETWLRMFYDMYRPTYAFDVQLVPINPADIEEPAQVAAGFQATSHVVNLVNAQQAMELARSQDNIAELSRIFYGRYADNFDFLMMVPEAETFTGPAGEHTVVQNNAYNIGQRVWNGAQSYGSAGRLKGISFLDFAAMPVGPKLHELIHQWAAPDLAKLNIGQCTVQHWGVMGQQGQLGGFDSATLVDEGAGRYSADFFWVNSNSSVPYSPLELYLAGFAPAEEVPPIVVPRNVQCSSLAYSADRTRVSFQASGLDTVTIDQIMAQLHGPRFPGYQEAQRNFTAAMIAVSSRPLAAAEMAFFGIDIRRMSADSGSVPSFAQATGGRATLDTRIGKPLGVPNDPQGLPPGLERVFVPAIKK